MVLLGLEFSLITFGLAFVVAFVVAAIIKLIAVAVHKRSATNNSSK
jgi:hypothetical protein